jgi:hypothetical protein
MSSEAAEEEKNANEDPLLGFMFGNIGQDEELENEYELDKVSGGLHSGVKSICLRSTVAGFCLASRHRTSCDGGFIISFYF